MARGGVREMRFQVPWPAIEAKPGAYTWTGMDLIVRILAGPHYTAGFLASLACSTVIVYVIRRSRGGNLTDPGHPPLRR